MKRCVLSHLGHDSFSSSKVQVFFFFKCASSLWKLFTNWEAFVLMAHSHPHAKAKKVVSLVGAPTLYSWNANCCGLCSHFRSCVGCASVIKADGSELYYLRLPPLKIWLPVLTHFYNVWHQEENIGHPFPTCNLITTETVYPWKQLTISHMYCMLLHVCLPYLQLIASLWFKRSQQGSENVSWQPCLWFCCSDCLSTVTNNMPSLCLLWLTLMCFFVGMTFTGVWLMSLTPRAEWAATAQTPTAPSASRQRAPTKKISPSPPTCQPPAPSTHSCRVSVFYCSSQMEPVT